MSSEATLDAQGGGHEEASAERAVERQLPRLEGAEGLDTGLGRRLDDLAQQQRNGIITEPLAALESDMNVKGLLAARLGLAPEQLDLRYVAIVMLDHIMEESAFRPGAQYEEVVEVGSRTVARMYPGVSEELAEEVASWVFDQVRNRTGQFREFQIRYFDDRGRVHRVHNFRYVEAITDPDDVNKTWLRLSKGGQKYLLGMLDIAEDMLDEVDRLIIRKAFERNRFSDALTAARRSKGRSAFFRHDMEDMLLRARRDWRSVDWAGSLGPRIEEAIAHIRVRQGEEDELGRGLADKAAELAEGSPERKSALELKEEIDECSRMHGELLRTLFNAGDRFRDILNSAFALPPRRETHDPEREILVPMLEAPVGRLSEMMDVVSAAFSGLNPPLLLHLRGLFEDLTAAPTEASGGTAEDEDEVPLAPTRPLFDKDRLEEAGSWLDAFRDGREEFLLSEAIDAAAEAGFGAEELRAVVLMSVMPMSVPPDDRVPRPGDVALDFEVSGEWAAFGMGGDDIVFRRIAG